MGIPAVHPVAGAYDVAFDTLPAHPTVGDLGYPYTSAQMLDALGDTDVLDLQELPQYGYDLVTARLND